LNFNLVPTRTIFYGFLAAWTLSSGVYFLFSKGIGGIEVMGPDVALFMLFHLVLMWVAAALSSYIWYKIPLPLKTAKSLALFVTLPIAVMSIQHKEMGWEAFNFAASSWQNHQFLLIFILVVAYIWSRVGPWFSRRFFFPELP
jgi:hypothetical protein